MTEIVAGHLDPVNRPDVKVIPSALMNPSITPNSKMGVRSPRKTSPTLTSCTTGVRGGLPPDSRPYQHGLQPSGNFHNFTESGSGPSPIDFSLTATCPTEIHNEDSNKGIHRTRDQRTIVGVVWR